MYFNILTLVIYTRIDILFF